MEAYAPGNNVVNHLIMWQNFLFSTRDEDAPLKVIDFGLSDFIRPGNASISLLIFLP